MKLNTLILACWNSRYVSVVSDTQTNVSIEHGGQQRQRQVVVELTSRGSDKTMPLSNKNIIILDCSSKVYIWILAIAVGKAVMLSLSTQHKVVFKK